MARPSKEQLVVKWVGHEEARSRLANAVQGRRTAHAYLISGPEGIGKSAVAVEFARLLLCDNPGEEPCGNCQQCIALRTLHHPDLHIVAPSGSPRDSDSPGSEAFSKELALLRYNLTINPYSNSDLAELSTGESKSARRKSATGSKTRVADSRELLHNAHLLPFQASRSVYLVLNADAMLREAQNRLLKLLEEPPATAVFILTTANLLSVLPTVRSRCQQVKLLAYTQEEILNAMVHAGVAEHTAQLSAALCEGNMRRAISFAGMQPDVLEQTAVDFLAASAMLVPEKVQDQVDRLLEDSSFIDDAFFELLTLFLSDAAKSKLGNLIPHFPSQHDRIAKLTATYPNANFAMAVEAIDRAAVSRTAGYTPALVLTALAIELNRALGMRTRA